MLNKKVTVYERCFLVSWVFFFLTFPLEFVTLPLFMHSLFYMLLYLVSVYWESGDSEALMQD